MELHLTVLLAIWDHTVLLPATLHQWTHPA